MRKARDLVLGAALAALFLAALPAHAAGPFEKGEPATGKLIDLSVSILPPDPFADGNRPGATPAPLRRGEVFTLLIRGTLKEGYHTYPVTLRAEAGQEESQLTRISFDKSEDFQPLYPVLETTPRWHRDERLPAGQQVSLIHEKSFHWMQDILVKPDASPGRHTLAFAVALQVCNESKCTLGKHRFEVPLTITSESAQEPSAEIKQRFDPPREGMHFPGESPLQDWARASKSGVVAVPVPAELRVDESKPAGEASGPGGMGLWGLMLTSILAAAAMLFTPCVFPMIPITVSFFLKQSEREHYNPLMTALVYSITIIVVLVLAVMLLGQVIVALANSPWLNLGLGTLLVVFALSLFGMFELELPHFLTRFTSAREGKGGYGGAFFMALTFTITSFTCTGPFLGPLLVATKELQLSFTERLLGSTAYATTFAAPFFLLALFPAALKALPRSGGWLNVVKVVMGFLELAMAFKFLGNMDISLHPGNPVLFTYEAIFAVWIALAVGCGLYLMGVFRLPHDTPVEHVSVARFLLATLFLSLGLYMAPALWHKTPQGVLGRFLVSFAPLDEVWELDYEKARARALAEGKLLFLDFTGVNCQNCRANEVGPFRQPEVKELLRQMVVVQLYNDSVPRPGLTREQSELEAERNAALQQKTFGDSSTPLYVVFSPDATVAEQGGKLQGKVLGQYKGYISDTAPFVDMLRAALGRQVAQSH